MVVNKNEIRSQFISIHISILKKVFVSIDFMNMDFVVMVIDDIYWI